MRRAVRPPPPNAMNDPHARLSKSEALDAAKRACRESGHSWTEPVEVNERAGEFLVVTNSAVLGGNLFIRIDATSGHVLEIAVNRR